jgi:hypothetical protein
MPLSNIVRNESLHPWIVIRLEPLGQFDAPVKKIRRSDRQTDPSDALPPRERGHEISRNDLSATA